MRAPIADASSMHADRNPRTKSSSRMRSAVAPVIADTGFIVMLPQSLYQTSRWMHSDASTEKPACTSRSTTARLRALCPPTGSPTMRRSPTPCRTTPGATVDADRCVTQPTTALAGTARASAPSGSTVASESPGGAPVSPWKNHHCSPFIAESTAVPGPTSGAISRATCASAVVLTDRTTRSCTPSSAGRSLAVTGTTVRRSASPSRSTSARPSRRTASSVAPRATAFTGRPARASRAAIRPPIAPSP